MLNRCRSRFFQISIVHEKKITSLSSVEKGKIILENIMILNVLIKSEKSSSASFLFWNFYQTTVIPFNLVLYFSTFTLYLPTLQNIIKINH